MKTVRASTSQCILSVCILAQAKSPKGGSSFPRGGKCPHPQKNKPCKVLGIFHNYDLGHELEY